MNEFKNCGVADILIAVDDGPKELLPFGRCLLPDAISAAFPETIVQTCIVGSLKKPVQA